MVARLLVCIVLFALLAPAVPAFASPAEATPSDPSSLLGDTCQMPENRQTIQMKSADDDAELKLVGQLGGTVRSAVPWGQYRLVALGPRLVVLDNRSTAPQVVGRSEPLPENIYSLLTNGLYVYAGGGQNTIFVFDLAVPAKPRLVSEIVVGGPTYDLAKHGARLYAAADWGGAIVLDVLDPARPVVLSALITDQRVRSVAVSGTTLYVGSDKGLTVFDAVDGSLPRLIGALPMAAYLHDIALIGSIAYAAEGYG